MLHYSPLVQVPVLMGHSHSNVSLTRVKCPVARGSAHSVYLTCVEAAMQGGLRRG